MLDYLFGTTIAGTIAWIAVPQFLEAAEFTALINEVIAVLQSSGLS